MSTVGEGPAVVLVADDSLVIRSLLRRQLEEQGYAVVEAIDGVDALRACREQPPDVVLLDVEMPELDGYGVLAELRLDAELADIPVVFLTARTTTEDVVEGLRLGAHDYLRKPFEPAELVARVSAAVRVKHLQDELRRRNAELDQLSRIDVLTGLPNRRHLQEQLISVCSGSRRHGLVVSVLMVDIDHFKSVNDTLGHDIGDVVLREVATRLARACRAEDMAGRWGGEEFLVISPSTDRSGAVVLAERVRARVADTLVAVIGAPGIRVTVSIGVACGGPEAEVEALLRRADVALYAAKESGRDRVVASEDAD